MSDRVDRCGECGLLKVYGDAYESRLIDESMRLWRARNPYRWIRALFALYREAKRLSVMPVWWKQ